MKLTVVAVIGASVFSARAAVADGEKLPLAADRAGVTFAADIQPIFDGQCVKCHGLEKQKAKLRLDSLGAVLKGGEDGKVIEPGNSAGSDLVLRVAHVGDPDTFMPKGKDGKPLSAGQVGLIRAWIDQGAK